MKSSLGIVKAPKQDGNGEQYTKIKLLGEGSFGKAYLVQSKTSGDQAVIKEIDISHMPEEAKRDALKEGKIMESLTHPNIIKFREVYKTKKGNLCLVMDYADGVSSRANSCRRRPGPAHCFCQRQALPRKPDTRLVHSNRTRAETLSREEDTASGFEGKECVPNEEELREAGGFWDSEDAEEHDGEGANDHRNSVLSLARNYPE
eukprot:TRINITY_DN12738_c0_g1_i2.p1 TRINITY_DN12738_c0_g1~~TRINITY_DN12738_c0_g1_i2.p1  ORF type:complete len:204 (+),score=21.15 TRINITY_DN12738_c0_g1_i2:119-730(+)